MNVEVPRLIRVFSVRPLVYHGGAVMHTATIRHVFWVPSGYALPASYRTLIDGFISELNQAAYRLGGRIGRPALALALAVAEKAL